MVGRRRGIGRKGYDIFVLCCGECLVGKGVRRFKKEGVYVYVFRAGDLVSFHLLVLRQVLRHLNSLPSFFPVVMNDDH